VARDSRADIRSCLESSWGRGAIRLAQQDHPGELNRPEPLSVVSGAMRTGANGRLGGESPTASGTIPRALKGWGKHLASHGYHGAIPRHPVQRPSASRVHSSPAKRRRPKPDDMILRPMDISAAIACRCAGPRSATFRQPAHRTRWWAFGPVVGVPTGTCCNSQGRSPSQRRHHQALPGPCAIPSRKFSAGCPSSAASSNFGQPRRGGAGSPRIPKAVIGRESGDVAACSTWGQPARGTPACCW